VSRSRRRKPDDDRGRIGRTTPDNPTALNEPFNCVECGLDVPATGHGKPRDHCPRCLASLHVDVVPGDRASLCGAVMDAVRMEVISGGEIALFHRCRSCGSVKRVRAVMPPEPLPDCLERLF
jgi:hypothetical protein